MRSSLKLASLSQRDSSFIKAGLSSSVSPLLWMSHFANRPGQLFAGAQNRLTIFLSSMATEVTDTFSSRYHRWDARYGEREGLFSVMVYAPIGEIARQFHGLYPKIGTTLAVSILRKLNNNKRILQEFMYKHSSQTIYWVRVPGYFCQFFLRPPMARPESGGSGRVRGEVKEVCFRDSTARRLVHAVLNSSTYFQFYCAYTDGRHVNPSDVYDFPFDMNSLDTAVIAALVANSRRLEKERAENTSERRKSGLLIESVDSRATKPILDEIDRVLAQHYGFSDEELDFILNYDIKYRMGQDDGGDGE
jgi:hypothetical protein